MKLNYRDKIVLTIAIVALVWIAGVMFGIKPGIEKYKAAQAELDDAKAQLATLEERIREDEDLDERIAAAYQEATEMTSTFYSYQQTQEATQKIDDLLAIEEIINSDMAISSYENFPLTRYIYVDETVVTELDAQVFDYENTRDDMIIPTEGTEVIVAEEVVDTSYSALNQTNIGRYAITFNYTGTLGSLKEFCTKLKESNAEKTIIVQDLTFKYPELFEEEVIEEDEYEVIINEDGEEERVLKPKTEKKEEEKEEEEDPNEKLVEGTITLNMIVVRKLPDPSKF